MSTPLPPSSISHLNIPHFPIAIARALHPRSLSARPLAIALPTPRAVVLDISAEARMAGLHRGMPLDLAQKLCPDLHILPPRPDLCDRATAALSRTLAAFSPLVELPSPGHAFLDLTGTERLWGRGWEAADRIRRAVGDGLRLWGAAGAGSNKLVSHVASRVGKPDGVEAVEPGGEAAYLSPLELRLLPGLGEETERRLEELCVRTAGALAATPAPALAAVFGAAGPALRDRARGIDPTPVRAAPVERDVREDASLSEDTNDAEVLADTLSRLVQAGARRLRASGIRAGRIEVSLTHTDGMRTARSRVLPSPADLDPDLIPPALDLLAAALQRRVRVRSLRLMLSRPAARDVQARLFTPPPENRRRTALVAAVDLLRDRFGADIVSYRRMG